MKKLLILGLIYTTTTTAGELPIRVIDPSQPLCNYIHLVEDDKGNVIEQFYEMRRGVNNECPDANNPPQHDGEQHKVIANSGFPVKRANRLFRTVILEDDHNCRGIKIDLEDPNI